MIKGASIAFLIRSAGIVVTMGLHVLLARLMSQTEYGTYMYAVTVLLMLSVLAKLGLSGAAVRYMAQYTAQKSWALFVGFLNATTAIVIASGVVIAAVLGLGLLHLPRFPNESSHAVILAGLAIIPGISLLHHFQECLRGVKKVAWALAFERVVLPCSLAAFAFMLFLLGTHLHAWRLVFAHTAILFLCSIILWAALSRIRATAMTAAQQPDYRIEEWRSVAWPLLASSTVSVLLMRLDPVIVGTLGTPDQVAGYVIADRIVFLLAFAQGAINVIVTPMVAEQFHSGRNDLVQRSVSIAVRVSFLGALPVAIAMLAFPTEILSIFGPAYTAFSPVLRILVIGQLINVFAGAVGPLLTVTGHQRYYMTVMVLVGVAYVFLLPIGYYLGSIEGVATAKVLTYGLWNMILARGASKMLNITTYFNPANLRNDRSRTL
jgi:O-antigen/teichoic acid export membrane protein